MTGPVQVGPTRAAVFPVGADRPHWDRFRDTAVGRYLLEREREFVDRYCHDAREGIAADQRRLLDVCCCAGSVTMPLRDTWHVVGQDMDAAALRLFRRPRITGFAPVLRATAVRATAVQADAVHLPFAEGTFQAVVALQCALYFDLRRLLTECARVLGPGGRLIVQVINRNNYKRKLKRLLGLPFGDHPSVDLGLDDALATFEACGFVVDAASGYNWLPLNAHIGPLADSRLLVAAGARIERGLRLHRCPEFSPWVLLAAHKPP